MVWLSVLRFALRDSDFVLLILLSVASQMWLHFYDALIYPTPQVLPAFLDATVSLSSLISRRTVQSLHQLHGNIFEMCVVGLCLFFLLYAFAVLKCFCFNPMFVPFLKIMIDLCVREVLLLSSWLNYRVVLLLSQSVSNVMIIYNGSNLFSARISSCWVSSKLAFLIKGRSWVKLGSMFLVFGLISFFRMELYCLHWL